MTDYPTSESVRTRPCLGCEGGGWALIGSRLHPGDGCDCGISLERCPACNGTGRQEDRRTAEQAMVDAETWALAAEEFYDDELGPLPNHVRAQWYGVRAAAWATTHVLFDAANATPSAEWEAFYFAREAGRAAFQAVPALRGE